ncbi:hypothetical protein ABZ357_30045 [Streptomyces sp. NPDC005917]|uniref:hypothetical protein n=1 Tax=unclassified Streptomyces TaxID=2593676 RepID=UPI0033DC13FA
MHRKKFPYRGYVEIESPYCPPFVMFSVNDDAVAMDTLWNGTFGYEPGTLATWSRLAARSATITDVGTHRLLLDDRRPSSAPAVMCRHTERPVRPKSYGPSRYLPGQPLRAKITC